MIRTAHRMIAVGLLALGLIVVPPFAVADDHRAKTRSEDPAPISARDFLTQAAAANRFEIVTGGLAQERAQSAAIRSLGAEFVTHHTEMLQQGAAVATQLGITVPNRLTREQRKTVTRLERLSGRRFDRAWLSAQIVAHREALVLHLRGAVRGKAPAIRTLAQNGLPMVTRHYGELLD